MTSTTGAGTNNLKKIYFFQKKCVSKMGFAVSIIIEDGRRQQKLAED